MNILLVVPRLNIGGAETYVATTAIALQQLGFNVSVASGGGILANLLKDKGIKHFFLPIRLNTTLAAWMLERIIKKHQIQLVHANSAAAGIAAMKAKQWTGIPVVYTAHGVFGHNSKEMMLTHCDKIICVSEYVRIYAIRKGFSADKLITVYSGIDLDKFRPDLAEASSIRRNYGIPEEAFTMAVVARIKNLRNKGHADILQVMQKNESAQKWHLLVIGKGKGLWQLKYQIWKNNLSNRVHCIGHIINVQEVLPAADVTVLPSNFETFGLVLAESMAMAKPAIAYAVGGTPEVIDNGRTGFLVEKRNQDELYQRLLLLASDKEKCREMGQQGRKWIEKHFDNKTLITKLTDIYRSVAGR